MSLCYDYDIVSAYPLQLLKVLSQECDRIFRFVYAKLYDALFQ